MDLDEKIEAPKPPEPTITDYYRACLCSPLGLNVLIDILRMCHWLERLDPNDPVKVAEYNIGMQILAQCNGSQNLTDTYELSVVQALVGLRGIPQ